MNVLSQKTILIAPLDWGLGHATRCMPIIDFLSEQGANVVIAGNGHSINFLKDKYAGLRFFELPGYNIQYPIGKNAAVQTLLQAPHLLRVIRSEHEQLANILLQQPVDLIISDNRYGVWNSTCKNVFLCHQVAVQAPAAFRWMNPVLLRYHFRWMKNFDVVWIPDEPGELNLSGKLSHGFSFPMPVRYIGIQSRFYGQAESGNYSGKEYPIVALLSGAEPQRTYFEKILIEQLQSVTDNSLLIQGIPQKKEMISNGRTDCISYMQAESLLPVLKQAKVIICRSGYSTLMDLVALGKKAILVPTPGQTEQEYLATQLATKKMAVSANQNTLDLKKAIADADMLKGFATYQNHPQLLADALEHILS